MQQTDLKNLTLKPLFEPESIAIFGASENKNKIGYLQLKALLNAGYKGNIYPINPKSTEIEGLPAYKSVKDVPTQIDLAILCVNANLVEQCLIESGESGVKSAIVFASGYSEIGEEGEKAQRRLKEIADKYNIKVIGPNCVGLLNTTNGLMGTFSPGLTDVPLHDKREVGFVTQSGAFGVLTHIAAAQRGLTFKYFVSVGNEADVQFSDVIEYMIYDPETKVASGYLEGEKSADKLRQISKKALEINKPIVIMKSGRSDAGSRAAASHTGALAGSDKIYDGFFKQTGIVRADDYDDVISFSKLFLSGKLPTGKNTVIVTSSGGRGINEADRCELFGLEIHELSDPIKSEIEKNIPAYASATNPVDLTAEASVLNPKLYLEPLRVLVNDPDTDNIIFTEFPMQWDEESPELQEFVELCKNSDKFVLISPFPLQGMAIPKGHKYLEDNGIPIITGEMNPIRALAKLVNYAEAYRTYHETKEESSTQRQDKRNVKHLLPKTTTLSESQSTAVLREYGIKTVEHGIATTADEAVMLANKIGYPVVMKIDSEDIPHKTDVGGIRLNIQNETEVREAYKEISNNIAKNCHDARINGISVQQMLPKGTEIIIGVTNDETFGPIIMFGLGGVFVEVFKDVSFRVAPITRVDAMNMIEELNGAELLNGVRNQAPADKEAIIDTLLKVSQLVMDYKDEIQEIDINPLIVYEHGIVAADSLIITR